VGWLSHAFALDPPGPVVPTEVQRAVVEKLCAEIGRRHLTTPALLMLEMSRPLNYVSAQLLHFFQPIVGILVNTAEYEAFTAFLEQRGAVDYLAERFEAVESAASARDGATESASAQKQKTTPETDTTEPHAGRS
jgi:hypothetical protein